MATDQTDLPLRDFGSIQKRQTPFWDHTNLRKAPLSLFFFFRCAIILLFFQKAAGHCLRGWKTYKSVKKIGERVCCELGCWGGWISITFVIPPPTSLLFFFLTPSIPCDIHSSAKCVWQALRLWAPSQWPLTLVCPDTRDEYLQDTEGKQAAMSGLYCVLPRLGTVSIIKQMTPEGCAPQGGRSRRRQSSGQKHLGRIFFLSPLLFPLPSYDLAPGESVEEGRNYCTALYKNVTRLRRTEFEHSIVAMIL